MTIKDIRPALHAFLLADSAISAAVGGERIYPVILQQGVKDPSIVYRRISGLSDHHSEGASGLARPRIQIDCYATTHAAAVVLANLVKARIDGVKGVWGSGGNAVTVQGCMFADREDDGYEDATKLYSMSRDYFIWYEEL